MGVSKNWGGPPKWMVKIMENPIKMDDLGVPLFFGNIHIGIIINYIVGGLTNSTTLKMEGWKMAIFWGEGILVSWWFQPPI